jgi:hypothetical protein
VPLPSQLAGRAADHVLRRQRRRRRGRDACGASSSGSGGGGGGCQQCELIHTLSFQSQPIHVLSRTTSTSSKHMQYTQKACARASINHSPFSLLPLTSPQSATTTCTRVWPPPCEGGAKNASLFSQLFLCFSRACLGKKIAYIYIYIDGSKRERGVFRTDPTPSIALTTAIPSVTRPKTTCLPSSQEVIAVVRKNCEPFVFLQVVVSRTHARICIPVSERDEWPFRARIIVDWQTDKAAAGQGGGNRAPANQRVPRPAALGQRRACAAQGAAAAEAGGAGWRTVQRSPLRACPAPSA